MKLFLALLTLASLFGCGRKTQVETLRGQGPAPLFDLATIPAGRYALKSLEITVNRYGNQSAAVMKHRCSRWGVLDDRNDKFSVTATWDARETRHFLYAFLNVPTEIVATGSRVTFTEPKFYSSYADKLNGGGRAVVWEEVGGLLFHHAYSRGTKNGVSYQLTLRNNFIPDDSAVVTLSARPISEQEIRLEFTATFQPPGANYPSNFPGKYVGEITYILH